MPWLPTYARNSTRNIFSHWNECCDCDDKANITKHSFTSKITVAPTSTQKGERLYSCTCGYSYTEEIAATGHSYSDEWSYDEDQHWHECNCGDKTDVAKHTITLLIATYPTCTKSGVGVYRCDCGYSSIADLDPTGHDYSDEWSYDAEDHWHECVCGDQADLAEHTFVDEVTTAPSCTEPGVRTFSCACGYSYTEEIPATGNEDPEDMPQLTVIDCENGVITLSVSNAAIGEVVTVTAIPDEGYEMIKLFVNGEEQALLTSFVVPDANSILVSAVFEKVMLGSGTWGDNVTWTLDRRGLLTISGTGEIDFTYSGTKYPWGPYADQITKIVVEHGITGIPSYAFEYCESVTTIKLPETLTSIALNAFNDCGSLNNLLLPSTISYVSGAGGELSFIRCESLTDVYYLGTAEEWETLTNEKAVSGTANGFTIHFLQLHEIKSTCTETGIEPYYQFDDTSIHSGMYNLDKQPISQTITVPALGHTEVVNEAVAPGCTTIGLTAGKHCSACGKVLVAQENISATNHANKFAGEAKDATCTEDGHTAGEYCPDCKSWIVPQEVIPATDHNHSGDWTFDKNKHWHECVCGDQADLAEHTFVDEVTTSPSCTEPGEKTYTCTCGYSYTEEIAATGHNYSDEWSCDEDQHWHECSCGDKADLAKHTFVDEVTTSPSCTELGVRTYTCTCGYSYTEEIAATGHNYSNEWSYDKDQHWHECSCGDKADLIEHNFVDEVTTSPSCTEPGVRTFSCTCGYSYTEEIEVTGHSYMITYRWATDFSCTAVGTCENCDNTTDGHVAISDCSVSYDNSVIGKLSITISFTLGDEKYSECMTITGTINGNTVTISLPGELDCNNTTIIIVGYAASGRMTDCKIVNNPTQTISDVIDGDNIQVFIVGDETYVPLLINLQVK